MRMGSFTHRPGGGARHSVYLSNSEIPTAQGHRVLASPLQEWAFRSLPRPLMPSLSGGAGKAPASAGQPGQRGCESAGGGELPPRRPAESAEQPSASDVGLAFPVALQSNARSTRARSPLGEGTDGARGCTDLKRLSRRPPPRRQPSCSLAYGGRAGPTEAAHVGRRQGKAWSAPRPTGPACVLGSALRCVRSCPRPVLNTRQARSRGQSARPRC
jgi:hypothetical protein